MNLSPLVAPPASGKTVWMRRNKITLKATAEQTGGAFGLVEMELQPESGPAPHIHHREEEAFYVLEGEVAFYLPTGCYHASTGCFVRTPRGLLHSFCNETDAPARLLALSVPGGFEVFYDRVGRSREGLEESWDDFHERSRGFAPYFGMEYRYPVMDFEDPMPARRLEPDAGEKLEIFSNEFLLLTTSTQTGGQYNLFVEKAVPGSSVPLHTHHSVDEALWVLQGEGVWILPDGVERPMQAGTFCFTPKGTPHAWRNPGEHPLHLLTIVVPGGSDLLFREIAGKTSVEEVKEVAGHYGMSFV